MNGQDLFKVHRSADRLNENFFRMFGKKINLENFDLDKLQDARNRLRTQISQIRNQSNFNETVENDAYLQATMMLDAINAEITERDEHIVEADVEEGKMKDLHQDVEEYLAYMSDVFNDREEYDLANELHNLSFELEKVGIGGVMKELKQLTYWGDPLAKGVYKEFSKKFGKFAEGFDGDLEEGKHEVDYDLHQLALYGDEEDLIDALGGDQGPHVAEALKDMMEELKDELASKGMNDVMRDEDKMIEMLADKLFDEYGEDGEEYGDMDPRYDRNDGDADADALKSAGFGSDEDYESVQNEKAPDVVRNIAGATTAALGGLGGALLGNMFAPILGGVAGAIGGAVGGAKVGSETADAVWDQVSSMLGGEKKATEAGIAHAKAAKAGESSFEFDGKEYEVTLKPQEVGKAVADLKAVKEAYTMEKAPPGAKAERMVKHIKKGYADDGKLTKKEKSIAYATAWKHHNKNKDISTDEGIISTPAKLIGKTIGGVSKAAGAIAGVPGGIARAFGKGKRRSQDVISGDDEDRRRKESVERGDKMTKLREGDYYYDHDDERSGSTGAIMRSNTPVYDKLVKAVTKENPNVKTAKDLVDYYGDEIEDVIAKLYAEGRENKAPKPQRAAMMLEKALKQQTSESIVREGEVQQASAIVTAKTMVDRVGRWIEELSGMENETLLQLGDSIRDEMGQEQSRAFIEQVAPAIQQALETLKGTRETISNSVNTLATGEAPADMLGSEPAAGGDMEMPAEEPAGDEFAAAEPAAGGAEAAGREQRESIQFQNRLMKMLAG